MQLERLSRRRGAVGRGLVEVDVVDLSAWHGAQDQAQRIGEVANLMIRQMQRGDQ